MTVEGSLRQLASELAVSAHMSGLLTRISLRNEVLDVSLPILGSTVGIRVEPLESQFAVGVVGFNPVAVRWIHDVLGFCTRLMVVSSEGREIAYTALSVTEGDLMLETCRAIELTRRFRHQEESGNYSPDTTVPMYWSSGLLNFGDWIGPHLIYGMTGRQPVLQNRVGLSPDRVLWSVGSILGWFKSPNVDVWGSGLIRPLTQEEALAKRKLGAEVKIHAVRGVLTMEEVTSKIGWHVPEIIGDPGLLLPDIMPRAQHSSGRSVVVPHYIHRQRVESNPSANGNVVDVRNDVFTCASQISGATAVVSSSLHGIVLAQAYEVPWVWLRVDDLPLTGVDFKFEDFFTCLDRAAVASVTVRESELSTVSFQEVAKRATLPELKTDLDALRDALPVRPASRSVDTFWE
ncbi:polysaccharide pyruvyl transferase family protein [Actinomycetaceae bacterium MB13-C1-2]|nr:polysaccharide pyruvyl transferase family protein [Actinomycetaceae bacterium MB13-C1-2]